MVPYAVWVTNFYLAWRAAWCEVRQLQSAHVHHGALITAWLRRRGFSHRSGLLARPAAATSSVEKEVPMTPPPGARSWCVAMNNSFRSLKTDPSDADWWVTNAAYTGSLAEVLDANFGGCHTSASVCSAVLAAMNVPAVLSDGGFAQRAFGATDVGGSGFEELGWPQATMFSAKAIGRVPATRFGHASLFIDTLAGQYATYHNDTLVGWSAWRFADPVLPWIPVAEWMVFAALLDMIPLQALGESSELWNQRLWAAHEGRTARSAVMGMVAELPTWLDEDAACDAAFAATGLDTPPLATRRASYGAALRRTVMAQRGLGNQDPHHTAAPQTFAEAIRNVALKRESFMPSSSAAHFSHLPMAGVVAFLTGGPAGVLPLVEADKSGLVPMLIRRACACTMGCDNGVAQGPGPKGIFEIPYHIEPVDSFQAGDPEVLNRTNVTPRWGDLPLNWLVPHPEQPPAPLTDDDEVIAAMCWILLTLNGWTPTSEQMFGG